MTRDEVHKLLKAQSLIDKSVHLKPTGLSCLLDTAPELSAHGSSSVRRNPGLTGGYCLGATDACDEILVALSGQVGFAEWVRPSDIAWVYREFGTWEIDTTGFTRKLLDQMTRACEARGVMHLSMIVQDRMTNKINTI